MIQFLYQTRFPLFLQLFSNTKKARPASQAACCGAAESHVCYVGRLFVVVGIFENPAFFLPTTPQHSYSFLFRCFPVSFFSSSSNRAKVFWKKLVRDGWWQPRCPSFLCPHLPLRLALLSLHTALALHQPASSIHYCVLTGIAFFL